MTNASFAHFTERERRMCDIKNHSIQYTICKGECVPCRVVLSSVEIINLLKEDEEKK